MRVDANSALLAEHMKYRLAIFDFDGTLADSFPFFVRVFDRVAEQHQFKKLNGSIRPELRHFHPKDLMKHFDLPAWKLPFVAKTFISLMNENSHDIPLFNGVNELLEELSNCGISLAIVSSNSEDNIRQILGPENVRLIQYFDCGSSIFGKASRLKKILKQSRTAAADAVYIGDQISDLEAAHKVGIAFGAVSWGYGAFESLTKRNPQEHFETLLAITRIGK